MRTLFHETNRADAASIIQFGFPRDRAKRGANYRDWCVPAARPNMGVRRLVE
jgi:hypothetical protein